MDPETPDRLCVQRVWEITQPDFILSEGCFGTYIIQKYPEWSRIGVLGCKLDRSVQNVNARLSWFETMQRKRKACQKCWNTVETVKNDIVWDVSFYMNESNVFALIWLKIKSISSYIQRMKINITMLNNHMKSTWCLCWRWLLDCYPVLDWYILSILSY